MTIESIIALVISGVSLLIAVASFVLSLKSQHLQNKVNTIEIKLKEFELKEKEEQQQKKACVEARVNHISQNKYKIKIWNSGNSIAKNVSASWNNTKGIILFDNDKMPFEFLEPQKGFDLSISTYNGAPRKMCIITTWEDEKEQKNRKEQWCDL